MSFDLTTAIVQILAFGGIATIVFVMVSMYKKNKTIEDTVSKEKKT